MSFLGEVCRIYPCTLHFFDEASVISTTGNRRYGHSYISEPAIEFQRYASKENFTGNLLHSVMGADHYSILDGPSNGTEMLLCFDDTLSLQNPDGSTVLERGNTVVMDNVGFHHGCFAEGMLRIQSTSVISPALLSSFEYMRVMFPPAEKFPLSLLKVCSGKNLLVAAEGITRITQLNFIAYFYHCGYLV